MAFQPSIPLSGVSGWRFLERTQAKQQAAFESAPQIKRDLAYFEANIGKVKSAEELVSNRRLLGVALTAFGLEGEIDKKAYIRKILESGTADVNSLANRVSAPGFRQMTEAFGFGDATGSLTGAPGFKDKIVAAYKARAFEGAVGNANNDIRVAMNFRREFEEMSRASLRAAFETVPEIQADVAYVEGAIAGVRTPEALVSDPVLLRVALTAYGLESYASNPGLVRDMLAGGVTGPDAPANRLGSPKMKAFVAAFGFGQSQGVAVAQTSTEGFAARLTSAYKTAVFDAMIEDAGNKVPDAMRFKREVEALAKGDIGSWFSVLTSKPMRAVFEKAFNLPGSFGRIDIDQQRNVLIQKTQTLFGSDSLRTFEDPNNVEKMIVRYLVRSQIDLNGFATPAASALSLLQNLRSGSQGLSNLFASRT